MEKISQALLLSLGISLEACAPPQWADFPDQDERESMGKQVDKVREATPWTQQIIRHSNVDFVDLEGNKTTAEELAKQLPQISELLDWFYISRRILVADEEDFPRENTGGQYNTHWLNQEYNDWTIMNRTELDEGHIYAHEMGHHWSPWHTDEINYFLDHEEELYQEDTRLGVALSSGDPAYIVGEGYFPGIDLDETTKEFLAGDLNENIIHMGQRYIEERGYTPQQAYDYLYKDHTLRTYADIDWELPNCHYDNNIKYYQALKIDQDQFTEMVLTHEPFMEAYKEKLLIALDAFAELYPDNEITTIREKGEELEDTGDFEDTGDTGYQERNTTDLNGYRPTRRLK